jgi:hypothetical protein
VRVVQARRADTLRLCSELRKRFCALRSCAHVESLARNGIGARVPLRVGPQYSDNWSHRLYMRDLDQSWETHMNASKTLPHMKTK